MRIYTYAATEDGTPGGQYVARIWTTLEGLKGPHAQWLPIIFAGPSEGSVRLQATTYWDKEIAKAEGKRNGGRALGTKTSPEAPAPAEDDFDVL